MVFSIRNVKNRKNDIFDPPLEKSLYPQNQNLKSGTYLDSCTHIQGGQKLGNTLVKHARAAILVNFFSLLFTTLLKRGEYA